MKQVNFCSRTSLGTGRTIVFRCHSVGRVSRSSFYLPRRTAPQAGGVPADGTPTLKSVGYRIRLVRIL